MSLRDKNKIEYDYYEYLNSNDWVSHSTVSSKLTNEQKLINLTKVVESLQEKINILEDQVYSLQQTNEKEFDTDMNG
jgi:CII-binding regulator of phage lambda lysogenization HflD